MLGCIGSTLMLFLTIRWCGATGDMYRIDNLTISKISDSRVKVRCVIKPPPSTFIHTEFRCEAADSSVYYVDTMNSTSPVVEQVFSTLMPGKKYYITVTLSTLNKLNISSRRLAYDLAPKASAIFYMSTTFDQRNMPYLEVTKKRTDINVADTVLTLFFTDSITRSTVGVSSTRNDVFKVYNIIFGRPYTFTIQHSTDTNINVESEVSAEETVAVAPLPPKQLLVRATNEEVVVGWLLYSPYQNYFDALYINCSVNPVEILVFNHSFIDNHAWTNLVNGEEYIFEAWTASFLSGKVVISETKATTRIVYYKKYESMQYLTVIIVSGISFSVVLVSATFITWRCFASRTIGLHTMPN